MRLTSNRRWLWSLPLVGALIVSLVAGALLSSRSISASTPLHGFESCADLRVYYQDRARALSNRYDNYNKEAQEEAAVEEAQSDSDSVSASDTEPPMPQASAADAEGDAIADGGAISESGTNVQERGVDEPDIIKTDGSYLYVLRPQSLLIAEIVDGGGPVEVGRIHFDAFAHRQELLLGAGKALVVRQLDELIAAYDLELPDDVVRPRHQPKFYRSQSEVLEIDVSDPSSPALARELDLHGHFVSARMVDGAVRIVFENKASVLQIGPWHFDGNGDAGKWAERYNEAAIEASQLSRWHPLFGLKDYVSNEFSKGYALACTQTFAPEIEDSPPWQNGMSYLVSFNLATGLGERGSVGIISDNSMLYGSQDALYLATPTAKWADTAIHRFDVTDPLAPSYFGSGEVRGQLLSQWAMSEHDGYLRVATTIHDRWPTLSNVFVLEPVSDGEGQRLDQIGLVSGLGVTETIFAVRFAGDVGYVVTFRQTDPLYVLDLSDPTDPQAVGELKIPGFSRYLHPLSGGLLLGIGKNADERTGRELGLQASLFDVSDPSNPLRISVLDLGADARSSVEWDHRAFRYHDGTAWIPVAPTDWRYYEDHDGAFFGVRVSAEGLRHESTLRVQGEAQRALPLGEQIHLLSTDEIRTYALASGESQGRLDFADEWDNRWLPLMPPE